MMARPASPAPAGSLTAAATEPPCGASYLPPIQGGGSPGPPARAPLPAVLCVRPPAFGDTPEVVWDGSRLSLRERHGPQSPPVFGGGWTQ